MEKRGLINAVKNVNFESLESCPVETIESYCVVEIFGIMKLGWSLMLSAHGLNARIANEILGCCNHMWSGLLCFQVFSQNMWVRVS